MVTCLSHGLFWAAGPEMKHRRPSTTVVNLSCRVGPRSEHAVVVNVPASLHGTVMPLLAKPIDGP